MDLNWKFALGNAADPKADFGFGQYMSYLAKQSLSTPVLAESFDDGKWQAVNLPHDWAMELQFTHLAEGAWGSRPLGRNFPETSVGWYRKAFKVPSSDKGRRLGVEFEGVCHDCKVFVNGIFLGTHFSAYTSFSFDITDAVHYGGNNVLVVRVDAEDNEGWWYQGAGVYRHVWLIKTGPIHVPQWGTQVLTDVDDSRARVTTRTEAINESDAAVDVIVVSTVLDDAGRVVGSATAAPVHLAPLDVGLAAAAVIIPHPKLWSVESSTMYRLVTTLRVGDREVDRYETPFGIRTIKFDPDKGFLLNGKSVKIKGFCDHEQHVAVGVAVPDSVWAWRVRRLKEDLGANAIRMSHNPPAPALLDACDRQGMLVMDEQRIFSSSQEGLAQLESLVRRDRNHPSVIIWSAGNEEWGLQNSPFSDQIMTKLQTEFHHLDPTRQVTCAASNGGQDQGINRVADVRGINYVSAFEKGDTPALYHRRHPNQPIIGSEEGGGTDLWKFAQETPWYSGYFIWTGFSYYGECKWPYVVAPFGAMDICGFPRQPAYDFYQTNWAGKVVHDEVTGSSATGIELEPDRTSLNADGEDTSVVNVAIVDANHHRVDKASDALTFHISGPGTILGIGNSASDDHSSARDDHHNAFEGRAQVLVQTTREAGTIKLNVDGDRLHGATLELTSRVGPGPLSVP
jgi:beta-galactosidase